MAEDSLRAMPNSLVAQLSIYLGPGVGLTCKLTMPHTFSPIPFGRIGVDIMTCTPPQGYLPPSQRTSVASTSNVSAPAEKHLVEKERMKLMWDGASDPHNDSSLTGEEIIP